MVGQMQVGRMMRRQARAAAAPAVFLALVAYFVWNARQGAHGLNAAVGQSQELAAAKDEQTRAEQDVHMWELRVNALRSRIDADALDERARAMLNLSDPQDVIVPYGKGQRLF